jgi:hypothetical protein
MAGSYLDQAALAGLNDFKSLVKASLLKRAVELKATADAAAVSAAAALVAAQLADTAAKKTAALYASIIIAPDDYATRMAHLIAETNTTIGAVAPVVPSEGDTQYATNTLLPTLIV